MVEPSAERREERVKLFATALSNLGIATVVTGFVGPLMTGRALVATGLLAAALGLVFHLAGQAVLHYVVSDRREEDV